MLQIVKVDYASNTLTVSQPTEWAADAPVSLEFRGQAPDIGAVEVGMSFSGRRPKAPRALGSRVSN